ncbi:hypothetical protein LZ554_008783 [Drepanopeziza brunnea f. sp. 'monogermtubi']|nr:hypothetical protein LZ554_008783 [Drepanopeziza brunnea f. sp. 'monogermtubi']
MAPKVITVIGSLNYDLVSLVERVPQPGETMTGGGFYTNAGGKGANQAVACARLSRPNPRTAAASETPPAEPDIIVRMIGAVGTDEFGPKIVAGLKGDGIDVSGIELSEGVNTGVAVITVEKSTGENRIILDPGANKRVLPPKIFEDPKPDLIVMQLEIPLDTVLSTIRSAKEAGIAVLLNPAPAVVLPDEAYKGITHLILNETEAAILTGRKLEEVEAKGFSWIEVISEFFSKGVKNVVVTLGSKGAYYGYTWDDEHGQSIAEGGSIPAAKVESVVDTTAAGDTFIGSYAVHIVKKASFNTEEMDAIMATACKASARTVEKKGAQDSIPWADEIGS